MYNNTNLKVHKLCKRVNRYTLKEFAYHVKGHIQRYNIPIQWTMKDIIEFYEHHKEPIK